MYDHGTAFEKLLLHFEGQVTHMTKNNTTQVIDEYPPLPELAEHVPLPDHAGSIPDFQTVVPQPTSFICHTTHDTTTLNLIIFSS